MYRYVIHIILVALASNGLLTPPEAGARTWHILPDGSGDAPTIQAGIDSSAAADTILLANGIYTGIGNRGIDYSGKEIVLISVNADPDLCVIDCQELERAFHFHSGEGSGAKLAGVTVTNGFVTGPDSESSSGGAIYCEDSSSPTIMNCVFADNQATYCGGAIVLAHDCSPAVLLCTFTGNTAQFGAAVGALADCSPAFTGCQFSNNIASLEGGGGYFYQSSPSFVLCTFYANTAHYGGGILLNECPANSTIGCTFYGNNSSFGSSLHCKISNATVANCLMVYGEQGDAIHCFGASSVTVTCSDVYGNAGGDWVDCIAGQAGIGGNFSEDPEFCKASPWVEGDWTLQVDSPCAAEQSGCGLVGAWGATCPDVAIRRSTWGTIKAGFCREP